MLSKTYWLACLLTLIYLGSGVPSQADPQVTLLGTLGGRADGLAVSLSGQVVACDVTDGTIWIRNPVTGISSVYYQFTDGTQPSGATFDTSGDLIVADSANRRILEITPQLQVNVLIQNDPRILGPKDVAVGEDGTIYFTDFTPQTAFTELPNVGNAPSELWELSPGGTLTSLYSFWTMKPAGLKIVGSELYAVNTSLSVIYMADLVMGGYAVFATPALYNNNAGSSGPDGIDIGPDGTLYVALYGEGAVGVYDSAGKEFQRIAIPGPDVTSVAVSVDGQTLYVAEASTNGVYQVTSLPTNNAKVRTDVLTWHNDNTRTGQNQDEFILTPGSIANNFGLLSTLSVDGPIHGQPLFVYQENIPGDGLHNMVYVATENDTVYAFDGDSYKLLWETSLLPVGDNGQPLESAYLFGAYGNIGITSTPVIDRMVGANGILYVEGMSQENATGIAHQRLHMLDLATGTDYLSTDIAASVPGNGPGNKGDGNVYFMPGNQRERCALTISNGILYTSWATLHEGVLAYSGWIIGYDEYSLNLANVLNLNPNGLPVSTDLPDGSGNGFWNSGAGPAVDSDGNIYHVTANGPFDTNLNVGGFPTNGDFGDTVLRVTPGAGLQVTDYFTPYDEFALATEDTDLGSGGIIVLPDMQDAHGNVKHLAVTAGKDTNLYLLDRDQMGKFSPISNQVYQELPGILAYGMWATAAYFNGNLYFGPTGPNSYYKVPQNQMMELSMSNALVSTTSVIKAPTLFNYPGATPSISANGVTGGLVWAVENGVSSNLMANPPVFAGPASLHAYDAINIAKELYNSLAPSRNGQDGIGIGDKFVVPTVANGKVFVPTTNSLAIFGLLNNPVTVQSALSCKVSPYPGTNLDLPLGLTLANQTTEYRPGLTPASGPGQDYALVLNFTDVVDPTQATVQLLPQINGCSGTAVLLPNGAPSKQVVVGLLNILDGQQLIIQINGLSPLISTETVPQVNLPITFKLGVPRQ